MSWKKTDLERLKAASVADRLHKSAPTERHAVVEELLERGLAS